MGISEKLSEEDLINHYNTRVLTGNHKPSNDIGIYIEGFVKEIKMA